MLLLVQTAPTSIAKVVGKTHWVSVFFFDHTIVLYCRDRKIQVTKKCFTVDVNGLLWIAVSVFLGSRNSFMLSWGTLFKCICFLFCIDLKRGKVSSFQGEKFFSLLLFSRWCPWIFRSRRARN